MRLTDLIRGLEINVRSACADDPEITAITEDSRVVQPGALFVARPGAAADGRDFIDAALQASAAAILTDAATARAIGTDRHLLSAADIPGALARLAERFHADPSRTLDLVGVTGTNGKTTVAHLVRRILTAADRSCGFIGTTGLIVGAESRPAAMTTPGPVAISQALAEMRDAGCRAAALEVSSHALHQRRTAGLRFRVGVFTNLSGDHIDYHRTMDAYADAKAMLFQQLESDAVAIVNVDDPAHERMIQQCDAPVIYCTMNESEAVFSPQTCFATAVECTIDRLRADLVGPWGAVSAQAPLIGRHNVMNLLQAVAACHALGLSSAQIEQALPAVTTPPGRLEPVPAPPNTQAPRVFVDYAHTDDALIKAIDALKPLTPAPGRLIVVFGCGGDRDKTKRPRMGRAVAERAHVAFITSDNPRTEDPEAIINEIRAGMSDDAPATLRRDPDRAAAIHAAIADASDDDVILIAGKGHEDYQILPDGNGGTIRRRFVDAEVAAAALAARPPHADNQNAATRAYAS